MNLENIPIARSRTTHEKYQEHKKEVGDEYLSKFTFDLAQENIIHESELWAVIPNDYPYDNVFEVHHILVPKRVFGSLNEMTRGELNDLEKIKILLDPMYDGVYENLFNDRSVQNHFHMQIFRWKRVEG